MPSATRGTSQEPQASLPEPRRLVLDEDITYKLSYELTKRGKHATAVHLAGFDGKKDGALFKALVEFEPFVLVTWDNKMPFVHARELEHHRTTLAVVSRSAYYQAQHLYGDEVTFIRDVVHRWAHVIETQIPNTVRRYGHRSVSKAKSPTAYAQTTRPPR